MHKHRRDVLAILAGAIACASPVFAVRAVWAAPDFPETSLALKDARLNELRAYKQYVVFAQRADAESYPGIAYLFTALGTSELIHAQNYERVLSVLGHAIEEINPPEIETQGTKDNLIAAAEAELNTIEIFYPSVMERIQPEQNADALRTVGYSWASHKQHRQLIEKVLRWSPSMFETVSRRIDENTDRYYVCQICGSTGIEIPESVCPICTYSIDNYRMISASAFL